MPSEVPARCSVCGEITPHARIRFPRASRAAYGGWSALFGCAGLVMVLADTTRGAWTLCGALVTALSLAPWIAVARKRSIECLRCHYKAEGERARLERASTRTIDLF